MEIGVIRRCFKNKQYRYTKHGLGQRINRHITGIEIEEAILNGKIIENYPSDKYGPSCLIYGNTSLGRPLHIQIALHPIVSIVTAYEPDPEEWIEHQKRRR